MGRSKVLRLARLPLGAEALRFLMDAITASGRFSGSFRPGHQTCVGNLYTLYETFSPVNRISAGPLSQGKPPIQTDPVNPKILHADTEDTASSASLLLVKQEIIVSQHN